MQNMKIVTFSYDDGVTQDRRLIDLFNKYGLKATFNLNSALGGVGGACFTETNTYTHVRFRASEWKELYAGHEIAVHTLTHPKLLDLSDEEIIAEVENDRTALSEIAGYEVTGMAYPFGTRSVSPHVIDLIREHTGVRYSRNTPSSYSFEPQTELLDFRPTVHHTEWDRLFELGRQFVELKTDTPKLFYIWGHAYEFDMDNTWNRFEEFLQLISNRGDIRYLTNAQALLEN